MDNLKGAVVNAYDAARNAIEAHMNANGLRVENSIGSHKTVLAYADERRPADLDGGDVVRLDQLRELQHSAEYPMSRSSRVPLRQSDGVEAVTLCERVAKAMLSTALGELD